MIVSSSSKRVIKEQCRPRTERKFSRRTLDHVAKICENSTEVLNNNQTILERLVFNIFDKQRFFIMK